MAQCSIQVRGKPFPPEACALVRLGVLVGLNKTQFERYWGANAVSQVLARSDAEQWGPPHSSRVNHTVGHLLKSNCPKAGSWCHESSFSGCGLWMDPE